MEKKISVPLLLTAEEVKALGEAQEMLGGVTPEEAIEEILRRGLSVFRIRARLLNVRRIGKG